MTDYFSVIPRDVNAYVLAPYLNGSAQSIAQTCASSETLRQQLCNPPALREYFAQRTSAPYLAIPGTLLHRKFAQADGSIDWLAAFRDELVMPDDLEHLIEMGYDLLVARTFRGLAARLDEYRKFGLLMHAAAYPNTAMVLLLIDFLRETDPRGTYSWDRLLTSYPLSSLSDYPTWANLQLLRTIFPNILQQQKLVAGSLALAGEKGLFAAFRFVALPTEEIVAGDHPSMLELLSAKQLQGEIRQIFASKSVNAAHRLLDYFQQPETWPNASQKLRLLAQSITEDGAATFAIFNPLASLPAYQEAFFQLIRESAVGIYRLIAAWYPLLYPLFRWSQVVGLIGNLFRSRYRSIVELLEGLQVALQILDLRNRQQPQHHAFLQAILPRLADASFVPFDEYDPPASYLKQHVLQQILAIISRRPVLPVQVRLHRQLSHYYTLDFFANQPVKRRFAAGPDLGPAYNFLLTAEEQENALRNRTNIINPDGTLGPTTETVAVVDDKSILGLSADTLVVHPAGTGPFPAGVLGTAYFICTGSA